MVLDNRLGITNQLELNQAEERIGKMRAKQLFDSGMINGLEIGTYQGLADIHLFLFREVYSFAGKLREVNIAKGHFRFAPLIYLEQALQNISEMPHSTYDQIIEKYVEMNIAHPFREGNGRSTRIWLDLMLKASLAKVIDWNSVAKDQYLSAMERSVVNDLEIKHLLRVALTDRIHDRELYMKGIDISYFYEGYSEFRTQDL
jgi:cell filamentation protein